MAAYDSDYLRASVGDVLVRGMAKMVVVDPEDSVDFLGHYLLSYVGMKQMEHQRQGSDPEELARIQRKRVGLRIASYLPVSPREDAKRPLCLTPQKRWTSRKRQRPGFAKRKKLSATLWRTRSGR
eukprot:scaffold1661_cov251-Pinguiococcus_pyrenoidosus.AAC.37